MVDPTKYIGQTTEPVPVRVKRHRLPLERGGQTWGHEILPGRQGYTILRRVESSGDPGIDAMLLDLAEAEEIARWVPSENTHRPDPQVFRDRLTEATARGRATPTAAPILGLFGTPSPPTRRPNVGARMSPTGGVARAPRPVPWGGILRVALGVVWGFIVGRVAAATGVEWAPWAAVPVAAFVGPLLTIAWVRRAFRVAPRRGRRGATRRGRVRRRRSHW